MDKDDIDEDIEEIWKSSDWTLEARQLIAGLRKFAEKSKIAIILRHSYRKKLTNVNEMINEGITPQGYEVAKKFGESLPINRPIRLYHSVVPRCRETAEAIKVGFEKISGKVELKGKLEPLYKVGVKGAAFSNEMFKLTPKGFITRWIAGLYPPSDVIPFTSYCQNAAKVIWKQLDNAPFNCIDIHITHDLHLMALRWGWLGLPIKSEWVSYLGGFALAINQNDIMVLEDDKLESFEMPYWWNALNQVKE